MPHVILYDDAVARRFEPFATTRPTCELRAGALLVRERWAHVLGMPAAGFVSAPHLDGFAEFDAPPAVTGELAAGTWLVNARALPMLDAHPATASAILIGGRVAAARLSEPVPASQLASDAFSLEEVVPASGMLINADGLWLDEVWDLLAHLTPLLVRDIPVLARAIGAAALTAASGAHIVGEHPVWVEDGAIVEPMTFFDTHSGPVLLRRRAQVQAFTRVIGPVYVGADTTITTDRIAASSIGEQCRVHGEMSASILIGYANKGHDGFVGHSVLGRWVNLGAGTITSNLKNTYGSVSLWTPDGVRESGQQFLGTLFGDHAKTGIGMRLTTGCVLGAGSNVFDRMPPKAVAPFSWGSGAPYDVFSADKFVATARRMMARRSVALSAESASWWERVHAIARADMRWPR
jgi:UDP-N-acetylglucosamine diphosphorylase/glucosamine-1-phosphate N-acetyltransferase